MQPDSTGDIAHSEKKVQRNAILFISMLIFIEIIQLITLIETGTNTGDFFGSVSVENDVYIVFLFTIASWFLVLFIFQISKSNSKPKLIIQPNFAVLAIFSINLLLTISLNMGTSVSPQKSIFSFLLTLIPINYLILTIVPQEKINGKFIACAAIYIFIDLWRVLLGGLLKILYIFQMRASKKQLAAAILFAPIMALPLQALVEYKLDGRGVGFDPYSIEATSIITSRMSIISTNYYVIRNVDGLSKACSAAPYSSEWFAAAISVIPKRIFGLDYVKTTNNCLIEYRIGRPVDDSSVNAPWLATLYMKLYSGPFDFISYAALTFGLLISILKMANFLFGENGYLINFWVIFEFMWTGNILHLSIPMYFLLICRFWLYVKQKRV